MRMDEVTKTLGEIGMYFETCADNAEPGSKAHKRFERFMEAVDIAAEELRNMEDDGK